MKQKLPHVYLKVALSLDGYIDDISDTRRIFSNDADLAAVDKLRSEVDAIFVGAETLRKDDPTLRVRSPELISARKELGLPLQPLRVTASRSLNFAPDLNFFRVDSGQSRGVIYTSDEAQAARRSLNLKDVELIALPQNQLQLPNIFADLYKKKGVRKLLVEGGSQVINQIIEENLADKIRLALAPEFLGKLGGPRVYMGELFRAYNLAAAHNLNGAVVLEFERR